jgi:AMP-polyphosphate phosphotransferase
MPKKDDFQYMDEDQLSCQLIEAQYGLKNTSGETNGKSLLILVSGIELAGKGEAVKQLREWLDPRYLRVKADPPVGLDSNHTFWQPYARFMPAEGQIEVLFGNWYSDLLITAMQTKSTLDDSSFDAYIERMFTYEQDLKNNHVDVIKVWFDLDWKTLQQRLDSMDPSEAHWHKLHGLDWRNQKQYERLQSLRQRFTDDWMVIDGQNEDERNQRFAQIILNALQHCPDHPVKAKTRWKKKVIPEALLNITSDPLDKKDYKQNLKKLTRKVARALRTDPRQMVILFEGMDAAGKGGAIKRIVKKLDPREYEIHSIAAPEKYELRRPYLWRFWTKLQPEEKIIIFDRSWYGRVLVERLEGFASPVEWQRAYDEINRFEQDLVDTQTVVMKFWMAISKAEQAKRFEAREKTPHKRFKITAEDWRNREKWDDYLQAAADTFHYTHTETAPWHIIATDDKYTARISVLEAILKQLKAK